MKVKNRLKSIVALPLFVLAVLAAQFVHVLPASAASLTWTGGGDGTKFSDSANWSTGQVPVTGDSVAFPGIEGTTSVTLENDLTNVVFSGFQLNMTASSSSSSTTYSLDSIELSDGAAITSGPYPSGANNVVSSYIQVADLVGNGDLTVSGYATGKWTVAGDLTLNSSVNFNAGSVVTGKIIVRTYVPVSNNVTAASYEIGTNGRLQVYGTYSSPITTPVVVASGATGAKLQFDSQTTYDSQTQTTTYVERDYTFGSPITLNADLKVYTGQKVTARLGGQITTNGYSITKDLGSSGKLFIGDTEVTPETKTTTVSDSAPNTSLYIGENETVVLDGERGYVSVYFGAMLKGVGKADSIYVAPGAVVAPGHSPGTMTVASDIYISGDYQAEILNKDSYDKLIVGEEYSGSYNAVALDSTAHLDVVLPAGYSINQGDQFTIIDNKSSTSVDGIFESLPEGTQFTVNNVVFSITYTGGDGNDVVLTALNTGADPSTPNTGASKLLFANPVLVAGLGAVTAGLLIAVAMMRRKTAK